MIIYRPDAAGSGSARTAGGPRVFSRRMVEMMLGMALEDMWI